MLLQLRIPSCWKTSWKTLVLMLSAVLLVSVISSMPLRSDHQLRVSNTKVIIAVEQSDPEEGEIFEGLAGPVQIPTGIKGKTDDDNKMLGVLPEDLKNELAQLEASHRQTNLTELKFTLEHNKCQGLSRRISHPGIGRGPVLQYVHIPKFVPVALVASSSSYNKLTAVKT